MDFVDSLRAEADRQRADWAAVNDEIRSLEAKRERMRHYVDQLNPVLATHGIAPIDIANKPGYRGFAKPGNRNAATMPPRQPSFESTSLPEAIRTVLANGQPIHASKMVPLIYDVTEATPDMFRRAKRSLVGTLAEGARKGRWKKVSANTFKLLNGANGHQVNGKVAVTS